MRKMTLVVETVVLVMACVDCSAGDTNTKAATQTMNACTEGAACTCDDGSSGQKLCDSGSGVFIQCECRRSGLPRGTPGNNSLPGGTTPIMATGSSGFDAPTIVGGSTGNQPASNGASGTGASGTSGGGSGGAAGAAGAAGATAGSSGAAGAAGAAGSAGH